MNNSYLRAALLAALLLCLPGLAQAGHSSSGHGGHAKSSAPKHSSPKAQKHAAPAADAHAAPASHGAEAAVGPSPEAVLLELIEGNRRFVKGRSLHPRMDLQRILETSSGQHPKVSIVSCADSRVPVELLLDQGIGDVFTVRVAGNVCDTDEIGTVEYGVEHLGTPLLVVMGHTSCGAVKAVCTGAEVGGSIPLLVDNIGPAVERAHEHSGLSGEALVPLAVEENVWQSIHDLLAHSAITAELVHSGKLKIVGAIYDISSGEVQWLGSHPDEEALVSARLRGHADSHEDSHSEKQHASAHSHAASNTDAASGIVSASGKQAARADKARPAGRPH
ncbi:carbonic anhydrase [bacterium]|nr:carbonic anhydrase [bacterium]